MRHMTYVLIAALAANACTDATTDRSEAAIEETSQGGSAERAEDAAGSVTSEAETGEQTRRAASPPSASSSTSVTEDSTTLSPTMPEGVRGKWRRSIEASVTSAACVDSASANMGLILTIRADGFSRFEDGGRLIRVHERDASQIRATFDTTYADTPTQGEFLFKAQDNGQTLIERQYGAAALPGILRYRRCPQAE